uniref:Uncharacterized protein n=1 Tax=Klebsiella pneumoniae TaxID=573 RepID=A0A8B0SUS5_KLEPN|nr:hypothetical protein [Klebsiella pneumoniae]
MTFFKTECVAGSFSGSFHELELMLSQLELDCMALGKGCVLSKNFFRVENQIFKFELSVSVFLDDDFFIFGK